MDEAAKADRVLDGVRVVELDTSAWDRLMTDVAEGRCRLTVTLPRGQQIVALCADELSALEAAAGAPSVPRLTAREIELLRLIHRGASGTTAARELGVAVSTANQHLISARRKLGVSTSSQAAKVAAERHLLS